MVEDRSKTPAMAGIEDPNKLSMTQQHPEYKDNVFANALNSVKWDLAERTGMITPWICADFDGDERYMGKTRRKHKHKTHRGRF